MYDSVATGHSQIYLANADGTNQRQFTNTNWDEMMPTWSRDGRSIYYIERRDGATALWRSSLDGGAASHIADGATTDALESPDGLRVFFSKRAPGIWEASVNGQAEQVVPELKDVIDSRYCFSTHSGIYFVAQAQPPWQVRYFDFATRRVSPAANIDKTLVFNTRSLSISPDGNWMLHAQVDQIGTEILMIAEDRPSP